MRRNVLLILLSILSCNKDELEQVESFSATLVKQGICMNYVVQLNDIDFPQDLIEKEWTDEYSEMKYEIVFALKSVCDFPETIKKGEMIPIGGMMIAQKQKGELAVNQSFCKSQLFSSPSGNA